MQEASGAEGAWIKNYVVFLCEHTGFVNILLVLVGGQENAKGGERRKYGK